MNDTNGILAIVASYIGVSVPTLVFLMFAANQIAKFGSRIIPNDATGFWAVLRNICAVVGVDPSSRITAGVTVQDQAKAALTPPNDKSIAQQVAEDKGVPVSDVIPGINTNA